MQSGNKKEQKRTKATDQLKVYVDKEYLKWPYIIKSDKKCSKLVKSVENRKVRRGYLVRFTKKYPDWAKQPI